MINRQINPVEWSAFMHELEDANEHLAKLIADINADPEYDSANLKVDLGHVFAHLNRAWARREMTRDLTDEEWERASCYPNDLDPI
jgi:hypothetical protein